MMRLVASNVVALLVAVGLSLGQARGVEVEAGVNVSANVEVGGELNIGYFHDQLAPHGTWVEVADLGTVWQPSVAVSATWRPYMDEGHWIYTEQGWYWDSTYAWGWAAFHYGRWNHVDRYNWVWSPDVTWAPAWVDWRQSDSVYGWAPLSFGSRFEGGIFVGGGIELRADAYNFVPAQSFLSINLGSVAVPRERAEATFTQTKIVNNTNVYNDNRVVNNGIPVKQVSVATRQEITAAPIADAKTPQARGSAGQVAAFRPAIKNEQPKTPLATKPANGVATPVTRLAAVPAKVEPTKPAIAPISETNVKEAPKPKATPKVAEPKPETGSRTPENKPEMVPERTEPAKAEPKKSNIEDPKSEPAKPKVADQKPEPSARAPAPKPDAVPERTEQKRVQSNDLKSEPKAKSEPAGKSEAKPEKPEPANSKGKEAKSDEK